MLVQLLSHLTASESPVDPSLGVGSYLSYCYQSGLSTCASDTASYIYASYPLPTWEATKFLLVFNGLALLLDVGLPGKIE